MRELAGVALAEGIARGAVLALDDPLSFWGGLDPVTGRIVDRHHPQLGASVKGRVLVMPAGRGSSSSSTVLAESLRLRSGPAAVVLLEPDAIVALGSIVAAEMYGVTCPVVTVTTNDFALAAAAAELEVRVTPGAASVLVFP